MNRKYSLFILIILMLTIPPLMLKSEASSLSLIFHAPIVIDGDDDFATQATLEVWEGMQHEWHFAAKYLPEGRQAIDRVGQFIMDHLGRMKSEK